MQVALWTGIGLAAVITTSIIIATAMFYRRRVRLASREKAHKQICFEFLALSQRSNSQERANVSTPRFIDFSAIRPEPPIAGVGIAIAQSGGVGQELPTQVNNNNNGSRYNTTVPPRRWHLTQSSLAYLKEM